MTRVALPLAALLLLGLTAGCDVNRALEQLSTARKLSADLLVQFTKAADAANRAVMADTDAQSVDFAHETDRAKRSIENDVETLQPLLKDLNFSTEEDLLQQFVAEFTKYDALDKTVLGLAVENTNLKAQRLSFGPAQAAADAFTHALESVTSASPTDWHVKALAADAIASMRGIQVMEAPHIADPDDRTMTSFEQRMAAAEAQARGDLAALIQAPSASREGLRAASAALDQFMSINAQITSLSRRNTNVRSLALSLNEKRPLTAACEKSLLALRDALAKRGYGRGRWG